MAAEISYYKTLRDTLDSASAELLSPQAAAVDGPAWDMLQETAAGGDRVIIAVVQLDAGTESVTVRPRGLRPDVQYEVYSVDGELLGSATGAELMADGIDVAETPVTAAHMFVAIATAPR
jgi:hypothetical protein